MPRTRRPSARRGAVVEGGTPPATTTTASVTPSPAPTPEASAPRVVNGVLCLGERRVPLWSGALHYFRMDPSAWAMALRSMRAMGLEMVESYVPWSVHERQEDDYDFGSHDARLNLGAFLREVHAQGMLAFLRPGPHINAELTHFGLPSRIVHDDELWARSPSQRPVPLIAPPHMFAVPSAASTRFRAEVAQWFDVVAEQVRPHLWPDGPVVLLQVDNEAAFYFRDGPFDQDYHPDAISFHRERLRARYGDDTGVSDAYATPVVVDALVPPARCDATTPQELLPSIDWMRTHEELICDSLRDMGGALRERGLGSVPHVHNLPMGDFGLPTNVASVDQAVGWAGLDYYQTRDDAKVIKARTLRLCGTVDTPFAPELGAGAPPWFVPRTNDDSLFTALCALAFGLRGLNLYMAVARDRWYGAPIDVTGAARQSATAWQHLFTALRESDFSTLKREARIGLVLPRQYAWLSRATHALGFITPSVLDLSGTPAFSGCTQRTYGFADPIQLRWWQWIDRWAVALTAVQVPFVYVDDDARDERLAALDVLIVPSYETFTPASWDRLTKRAATQSLIYGPRLPTLDDKMRPHVFRAPADRAPTADSEIRSQVAALAEQFTPRHQLRLAPRVDGSLAAELTVHDDAHGPRVLFLVAAASVPETVTIETPHPLRLRDPLTGSEFSGTARVEVPIEPRTCRMLVVESGEPRSRS